MFGSDIMNWLKSAISLTFSVLLCISSVSCSRDTVSDTEIQSNQAVLSLKSADIGMFTYFDEIINIDKNGNNILVFGKSKDGEYCGYETNSDFSEKKSFTFNPQEEEIIKSCVLMKNGKKAVLTALQGSTMLYIFDVAGNPENTYDCGEIIEDSGAYVEVIPAESGFYVHETRENIKFIDETGEYIGDVDISGDVCRISKDRENSPVVFLDDGKDLVMAHLNGLNISEETKTEDSSTSVWTICAGVGDYDFTAVFSDGLFGLKESQWVKICDFTENSFSSWNIFDMIMTDENEFAVVVKTDDGKFEVKLLSERDISEIKEKKVIKMAVMLGNGSIIEDSAVKEFNSESDEYKIELVNYGKTGDYPSEWAENLKTDIISGNAPDIVQFNSYVPIDTFSSKDSLFVNFYTLLDDDSDIRREDFVDGFLEGMESDGKLLCIDSNFYLNSLCVKEKFADGLSEWNYDKFVEIYNNMPDDMILSTSISDSSRTDAFMKLVNIYSFVNYKDFSCRFDSEEFINMMKMIQENEIGLTAQQEEAAQDSPLMTYTEQCELYRTDKALALECNIDSFFRIKEIVQGDFNEPAVFIGYPSESGNGTYRTFNGGYSIMSDSENVNGAWEFLKYYLFSEKDDMRSGFSGLEKTFTKQLEYEKTEHTEQDPETGEMVNADGYWLGGDFENTITIEPFTADEADKYEKFVRTALKSTVKPDDSIEKIVRDELDSYFNGENSVEDTASAIQNRVSLYLSESYK